MIDASINIGNKFNEDGSVRFFPGNSIVSMISHEAEVWKAFCAIREMLLACPASRCPLGTPSIPPRKISEK